MKLDILKKLISLANNNPNENEANLAARKVCKALDEFTITEGLTRTTKPDFKSTPPSNTGTATDYQNTRQQYYANSVWEEFFGSGNRGSRAYYQRESEPKSTESKVNHGEQLNERQNTWQYEYFDIYKKAYYNPVTRKYYIRMFQDLWFEETGARHRSDTQEFRAGANYGKPQDEPRYYRPTSRQEDFFNEGKRKNKQYSGEDRVLKCKTCGQNKKTKFVGLEQIFECNECQWTAYKRGTEPKYSGRCDRCKTPITCMGTGYCNLSGRTI